MYARIKESIQNLPKRLSGLQVARLEWQLNGRFAGKPGQIAEAGSDCAPCGKSQVWRNKHRVTEPDFLMAPGHQDGGHVDLIGSVSICGAAVASLHSYLLQKITISTVPAGTKKNQPACSRGGDK